MDRSLIRTIRQLLSRSAQFEPQVRSSDDAIENLALLGGLEELARASLPQPAAPHAEPVFAPAEPVAVQPGAQSQKQSQSQAPAPVPAAPRAYSTSRSVYRPALKDPALIEALMKFHQEVQPAAPPREAPAPESKNADMGTGGFAAAPLPEVQAHPKPGGLKRPLGTHAVLRPHGPR